VIPSVIVVSADSLFSVYGMDENVLFLWGFSKLSETLNVLF